VIIKGLGKCFVPFDGRIVQRPQTLVEFLSALQPHLQARFKRIKGHRQLPVLFEALKRRAAATFDQDEALA